MPQTDQAAPLMKASSAGSNDAEEGEIPPSPVVGLSVPGDPSWTHPLPPVIIPKPPRENEPLEDSGRIAMLTSFVSSTTGSSGTRRTWIK